MDDMPKKTKSDLDDIQDAVFELQLVSLDNLRGLPEESYIKMCRAINDVSAATYQNKWVEVEKLRKPVTTYGHSRGEYIEIKNRGWNACLDYLIEQGHLRAKEGRK